ncbi:MAG: HD-GYP domain-containing protein [Dehalococcoidia bacterium]|nr:HD-GYP domain-containing protein [Dehalococcoidia bacterium]
MGEKINSLETIYQDVVNLIPDGFQYPDIACARLIIDDNAYATPNWRETPHMITSTITGQGRETGRLEVCYLEARTESAEGLFLPEEHSLLAAICERLGKTITRYTAQQNLLQSYEVLNKTFDDTIQAFSTIVEIKDRYTAGHQIRVARIAEAIAREMNLNDEQVRVTRIAGIIHDIGKIYIPADILSRPGRLSNLEFEIIKTHSQYGYDILKTINFPWPIAQIVLQHHEKLDGSGYPNGLKGDDILLYTRILTVADVVEAMASHRPYRASLGIDKALEEISNNKGTSYDSDVVNACVSLFTEKGFKLEE